jgi:hypothetical protein
MGEEVTEGFSGNMGTASGTSMWLWMSMTTAFFFPRFCPLVFKKSLLSAFGAEKWDTQLDQKGSVLHCSLSFNLIINKIASLRSQ